MTPAKEVGGDFYDFFFVDDDHIALVMADVSGKGIPAALFMMVARTLIKNRTLMGGSPSQILYDVNNQLCEGNAAELFVTVWLGILEISPVVAAIEGMTFKEHEFELKPGDSIFVYTDGVAEASDHAEELFGTDRMLEALNRDPSAMPEQVLENVKAGIDEFVHRPSSSTILL